MLVGVTKAWLSVTVDTAVPVRVAVENRGADHDESGATTTTATVSSGAAPIGGLILPILPRDEEAAITSVAAVGPIAIIITVSTRRDWIVRAGGNTICSALTAAGGSAAPGAAGQNDAAWKLNTPTAFQKKRTT